MSWVRTVGVVLFLTTLPCTGWGADMKLGLAGMAEFDDNIYRSSVNTKDDVVFRIVPKIRILEDEGKFQWDLGYRAPWERALRSGRVDGFSHLVNASADYRLNGQTQFFFTDRFTRSDSVSRFVAVTEAGAEPTLSTYREPVNRNNATLGVQHSFTPRLMGNLAFSHRLFQSNLPRRSDAMVYGINTNLVHAVSSRHRLGGGVAGTYQDFEGSSDETISPSQAFFLNMYATWTWVVDETLTFELTGGPTFVHNNQDAPPAVFPDRERIPYTETPAAFFTWDLASCGAVGGQPVLERCSASYVVIDSTQQQAIRDLDPPTHDLTFPSGTPSGGSDSSWTFFGEASLSKRWSPRLASTLSYRRTESTASGTGSATLDLVSLINTWRISELWDANLRADFTRRESTAPSRQTFTAVSAWAGNPRVVETTGDLVSSVVDTSLDTNRWGVSARMSRRISKHVYASLRYSYNEQSSKSNTLGRNSDFSNHLVTLGVQYDFDRWHLW